MEFVPDRTGEFGFACGMNTLHGKLVVEPAADVRDANGKAGAGLPRVEPDVATAVGVGPKQHVAATRAAEFALFADGVVCPSCVLRVESELRDMPGMDRVQVNYGAGVAGADFV